MVGDDDTGDDDITGDDDSTAATGEDGDGWSLEDGDCDDGDPLVNPTAVRSTTDGVLSSAGEGTPCVPGS